MAAQNFGFSLCPLLLSLLAAGPAAAVEPTLSRGKLLDDGWRFFRGNSPGDGGSQHPACPASDFPKAIGRCQGLKKQAGISTEAGCRAACCADTACLTWQLGGAESGMNGQCWIGDTAKCAAGKEGWTTAARDPPGPGPPTPPSPPPTFAQTGFDDSAWRTVEVPHDWSREDLPAREDDFDVPAITIRNGTWKFSKGDSSDWSAKGFDDSKWADVTVPFDWRDPPTSYEDVNATGWFRRHFSVSAKALAAYKQASSPTRLAVGEAACESTIYVNGEVVTGGTGGGGKGCLEFQAPQLDLEKIVAGDNVVAVRVHSQGGKAGTTAPHGYPGGLCDAGALAQHGVSVATGADWSPPSPFDPARTFNGRSYGYSVDGVGWYRLAFNHSINHLVIDEQTSIAFDGVYMNADFWLNGKHLGSHPYGYTYFHYDLTPLLVDGPNTIAVRVRNEGRNSRWYSGSGIFRHVRLITTPSVHIGQWGVVVQTTAISASSATVGLLVSAVNNGSSAASKAAIKATIMDGTGAVVASGSADVPSLAALNGSAEVKVPGMQIKSPKMWELASPHLYRVKVELQSTKGAPPGSNVDTVIETFGVRTIEFSTDGFKLNGKPVLLYGGCVHHDNGPLGSATIDRAEERRVENLKKLGYNAIRTSHNPVSPAFLDACDRLGVLVMHEAFDCWERGKNTDDYHVYFDQWWRRDLASMVRGSINRPSIVLWSIGNEIPMRTSQAGYKLAHELADAVRALDTSGRPVTSAVPGVSNADDPFFAALDVGGYNYSPQRYVSDHQRFPKRIMVGTESFPTRSFQMWDNFQNHSWVIGDFIWTAIDYIGESAIGSAATAPDLQAEGGGQPWQWHISFCGDIDIVGKQKPQSYYRTVLWDNSPIEMAVHRPPGTQGERVSGWGWPDEVQSWTWDGHEGKPLEVRVFAKCKSGKVALKLNGKDVSGSPALINRATQFTASFTVPFAAGKLSASCPGDANATRTFTSAKAAAKLVVTADRPSINAYRGDLSYVTALVVDADGTPLPEARVKVTFAVSGDGELAAVGSGDPTDVASFSVPQRTTWMGQAVAILRPTTTSAGSIKLTASAPGLTSGEVTVTTTALSPSAL